PHGLRHEGGNVGPAFGDKVEIEVGVLGDGVAERIEFSEAIWPKGVGDGPVPIEGAALTCEAKHQGCQLRGSGFVGEAGKMFGGVAQVFDRNLAEGHAKIEGVGIEEGMAAEFDLEVSSFDRLVTLGGEVEGGHVEKLYRRDESGRGLG